MQRKSEGKKQVNSENWVRKNEKLTKKKMLSRTFKKHLNARRSVNVLQGRLRKLLLMCSGFDFHGGHHFINLINIFYKRLSQFMKLIKGLKSEETYGHSIPNKNWSFFIPQSISDLFNLILTGGPILEVF